MKLELITDFSGLPEVKTSKIWLNNKFHPEGLFSEQIFGPVRSYQCQCKETITVAGQICPRCGVKVTSSSMRRQQFAKIKLGRFIHPVLWLMIQSHKTLKTVSNEFIKFRKYLSEELKVETFDPDNIPVTGYLGLDAVQKFFEVYGEKEKGKSRIIDYLYDAIKNNYFFVDSIIVIPPDLRPILENDVMDELNKLYISLLDYKEKSESIQTYFGKLRYEVEIQQLTGVVTQSVLERLGSKTGLLRNKLEGKRIDFSGRGVISVDPTNPITHCKVSRYILLELYKLDIAKILLKQKKFVTFKGALDYLQEQIDNEEINSDTKKLLDEVATNDVIILNRQPTLHRGSMVAFRVIPDDSFTIKINPLVCTAFNADFDGDQMALYRPLSPIARKEAEMMLASYNYLDPSNATLHFAPKQDIIYGIYKLSMTSKGREYIAKALGLDVEDIPVGLNAKQLNKFLQKQAPKDYTVFDKIKELGFKYTLVNPGTMSIHDFETQNLKLTGDRDKDYQILSQAEERIKNSFSMADVIDSGARASWDQAKQLLAARGYVSNFFGQIVPYPISSSFADGLTPDQFFVSSYGTRKGLLDVAENTAESGYLTRRLVYSAISAYLDSGVDDCGTKRTLPVDIIDENHAKTFIFRYYYDTDPLEDENAILKNVTEDNYKDLVGKKIYLRSPITCATPGICKVCYGDLHKHLNSKYIGVIASQSLGERSTQLVLRTFHTSGVAQGKTLDKQEDIISALQHVENLIDKKIQVTDLQQISDVTYQLYDLFKDYGYIHHVHFEVINAQKHRLENGKRWRTSGLPIKNSYLFSLRQIPATESWFLGIIFSNIRNLVNGVFSKSENLNILERIALGDL